MWSWARRSAMVTTAEGSMFSKSRSASGPPAFLSAASMSPLPPTSRMMRDAPMEAMAQQASRDTRSTGCAMMGYGDNKTPAT